MEVTVIQSTLAMEIGSGLEKVLRWSVGMGMLQHLKMYFLQVFLNKAENAEVPR